MIPTLAIVSIVLALVSWSLWQRQVALRREAFIRTFVFPAGLFDRLLKHHPQLTRKECHLISRGLRQYFLAHLKSGRKFVSMPSQAADDLWHEFILYTREYQTFCHQAFGRFFHHTPAVVLSGGQAQSNAGLRRCWRYVCREENIDPRAPTRMPLLFALDGKLHLANGFNYVVDCESVRRQGADAGSGAVFCGGDFSSSNVDGSTDGLDDAGDGGGDGDGGDGSGGCGGGD